MEIERRLLGVWRQVEIVGAALGGYVPDERWSFADARFVYTESHGKMYRSRYAVRGGLEAGEFDLDETLGIYRFAGNRLWICRSAPGHPRPVAFEGQCYDVFEYVGEVPPDIKATFKRSRRSQIEEIAEGFGRDSDPDEA